MNKLCKKLCRCLRYGMTAIAVLAFPLVSHGQAASDTPRKQTESPYFAVKSDDPSTDRLPLKGTQVDVRILGVIADVVVTQHYRNEGQRPIEARYVFPGSTRAAVYGMTVRLGDRLLTAAIREKGQAKIEYNQAKSDGKTAALLEQHRENVFQMNVANIMPGDDVKVELRYTELIIPTDGAYQFVFPTVVGPRYNGTPATGSGTNEKWISTPYLAAGELSATQFAMKVRLVTPTSAKEIQSPSHKIKLAKTGEQETSIELAQTGSNENNRDFILNYRLAGDKIESGLLLSRGDKENFFLAMVEPPKAVPTSAIVPRDYVFIVDISGSMHGFPLNTTKALMNNLLGGLRPSDTFNVMLFSGSNTMLAPNSVPATKANVERAIQTLNNIQGGGGTEIVPALKRALAMPTDSDRARSFIVITDGYVSVEREIFELIRKNLDKANVFSFGIGGSVNRSLIEGIARAGQGEPFIVLNQESAVAEAGRFKTMIDSPVLSHLKVRFEGFETYDVEPLTLPDVFARRPVILFGKWRGEPKGKLVLEGRTTSGAYRNELPVEANKNSEGNGALRYLWARHRVAALTDQETLEGGGSFRQAILDIGLEYNLLTQYTSFIAVDKVVRNPKPEDSVTVKQALPLPEGVSNLAVGGEVPSTPEPASWAMMLIAIFGMGWLGLRKRGIA
ncbi:MAG: vault protein inter-alpha-trypsin subunit [Proteobacteria bacterium]|nr:vault protein inter-alpha-trypsin subunit [Pseudomonadota bacterium]